MFTGIIAQQGKVIANIAGEVGNRLVIEATFASLELGESIAVNGVCLTLLSETIPLVFDVSPETLAITNLGQLKLGDAVNLERALNVNARLGGHYVWGHVDTTAGLLDLRNLAEYTEITVGDFGSCASMYLLTKGSIALEGVSLTINAVLPKERIKLMLVPHTLSHTNLGELKIGQRLNVEFDYLTRIVAHQLKTTGQLKTEV